MTVPALDRGVSHPRHSQKPLSQGLVAGCLLDRVDKLLVRNLELAQKAAIDAERMSQRQAVQEWQLLGTRCTDFCGEARQPATACKLIRRTWECHRERWMQAR